MSDLFNKHDIRKWEKELDAKKIEELYNRSKVNKKRDKTRDYRKNKKK